MTDKTIWPDCRQAMEELRKTAQERDTLSAKVKELENDLAIWNIQGLVKERDELKGELDLCQRELVKANGDRVHVEDEKESVSDTMLRYHKKIHYLKIENAHIKSELASANERGMYIHPNTKDIIKNIKAENKSLRDALGELKKNGFLECVVEPACKDCTVCRARKALDTQPRPDTTHA